MNIIHIGLDWSQQTMALAYFLDDAERAVVWERKSDLAALKQWLRELKGHRRLILEESTGAHWLFTELRSEVEELEVCDPHHNRLLSSGAKTDRIDAVKLAKLYRAKLTKSVFHEGHQFMGWRVLVSGYEDLIKRGVRAKNQRSSLYQSRGQVLAKSSVVLPELDCFVLEGLDRVIGEYEDERNRYEKMFRALQSENSILQKLQSIPGIGAIGSMKLAARIVTIERFKTPRHFWSYCGLVRLAQISGGKIYGYTQGRYDRSLKSVFKTAALAAIRSPRGNAARDYYDYLCQEKGYPGPKARHALARKIASWAFGVMKHHQFFSEEEARTRIIV